jgi:tyrosyl-tRNA synthetase
MTPEEKLNLLRQGVEEIVPEEELLEKLRRSEKSGVPLRIKYGIDPTGTDVHIGHLVPIRKMRQFQDMGHTGVIIIGDFTAQIGDPTGKNESRPPLTREDVHRNAERYMEQLYTVLDRDKTEERWQSEWFDPMSMGDVLKLLGQYTLAQFMAHETFRNRWESGQALGMHELMYPVLQAYDSVAVKADVELGATEQKFNLLCGRDLQRVFGQAPQAVMMSPILIGTDGAQKMSKSLNNYIAVFDPPNEKYGKVMSIPDAIIANYFRYATKVSETEIADLNRQMQEGLNPKLVKQRLAREIVAMYHGEAAGLEAEAEFDRVFREKEIPGEIPVLTINEPTWIVKVLTDSAICASGGEARRLIKQGGVRIDEAKIESEDYIITMDHTVTIKAGKRRFLRVEPVKQAHEL